MKKSEHSNSFKVKNITDAELIKRFKKGDESAFSEIVLRYQPRLLIVATAVLGDDDEAMDMVQEAFIKTYDNLKSFRGESSLYTWLYRILYNLCISSLRKKKIVSFFSFDSHEEFYNIPSNESDPMDNLKNKEIYNAVKTAMKQLPAKQRMVFAMKQFDELKHYEIAKIMGITEGAVKASYFHAIRKLRELLYRYGENNEL
jgi:RNA polymerase sigma-70 factor, ECF subfamily